MPTNLPEYVAFAVNSAATTTARAQVAWSAALDTAPSTVQLQLAVTQRPCPWVAVPAAKYTMELVACNAALATADLRVTDGANTVMISISRPVWPRSAAAFLLISTGESFVTRVTTELGVVVGGEGAPLLVDVDAPELKFAAAQLSTRTRMRNMETTLGLCGTVQSAGRDAERVVLVRVHSDGTYDVGGTPGFPPALITASIVSAVVGHEGVGADGLTVEQRNHLSICHFRCTDGHVMLVCARDLMR
jgi:hypothetical protein